MKDLPKRKVVPMSNDPYDLQTNLEPESAILPYPRYSAATGDTNRETDTQRRIYRREKAQSVCSVSVNTQSQQLLSVTQRQHEFMINTTHGFR